MRATGVLTSRLVWLHRGCRAAVAAALSMRTHLATTNLDVKIIHFHGKITPFAKDAFAYKCVLLSTST